MMQVLSYVGWLYFETTVGNGNTTYFLQSLLFFVAG